MKKINILNRKTIFIIIGVVLFIVGMLGCLLVRGVRIGASVCPDILGCTPEEFFDLEFDFYNEVGDFRKSARINKEGDLVLYLTRKQAKALIESLQQDLCDAENQYNIEVSEDYSVITVYGYEETYYEEGLIAFKLVHKMTAIRILKGEKPSYKCVLKDAITEEVVMTVGEDDNGEKFHTNNPDHKFSSITEKDKSSQ